MTWGAVAVAGAAVVGSYMSSRAQKSAGNAAAAAQTNAANAGIAEQDKQFTALQQMLAPYVQAGNGSLAAQQNLIGLNGAQAQQAALTNLQQQPYFQSQLQLGQNAILQNASATGGLRGGNTQAALAYFSPSLLAQTVQQQYQNLGGLTAIGQNAAAMTGNAGMQTGFANAGLLQQAGAANAGAALNNGRADMNAYSGYMSALGAFGGNGGYSSLAKYFGGANSTGGIGASSNDPSTASGGF